MTKEEKCSVTQKGRIVIHHGSEERRIYPSELEEYLKEGWEVGISEEHRKSNSEKRIGIEPWNKGTVGVMNENRTSFKKGNIPWNKGKKGVQQSTRKGLTKETSESVRRASISQKKSWENDDERRRQQSERFSAFIQKVRESEESIIAWNTNRDNSFRANNSYNTSKPEDDIYKLLCLSFGSNNVKRNYRDVTRYNHRCDFYIVSLDLFIELNLHWTHGGMPFDPDDEECQKKLTLWQEKAKVSKYYASAIYTWTQLDVKKFEDARKNNLKYLVVYPNKPKMMAN